MTYDPEYLRLFDLKDETLALLNVLHMYGREYSEAGVFAQIAKAVCDLEGAEYTPENIGIFAAVHWLKEWDKMVG